MIAVAVAAIGLILARPIDSLIKAAAPLTDLAATYGLARDGQTGFICLFASPALLVAGSLLPGI